MAAHSRDLTHQPRGGCQALRVVYSPDKGPDTAEQVKISALALLKMLKHSRAGVPFEVMGIMLGEFVNEYEILVKDVFSMPTLATTVSVESIDPAYQQ